MQIITIEQLLDKLKKYSHKELHVHHTWLPEHKHFNGRNGIELQQNMRNYHVNTNGWSDIGQHITLLPDGTFVTGRDFAQAPASIKGFNTGAFCVEMLGNFDKGHDVLQGKQKESILRQARFFYDRNKYIRFHRENSTKTCPGTSIDKTQFMAEVKALGTKQSIQEEKPKMDKKDAEKVITYLQKAWKAATTDAERNEIGRLADEVRVAAGMKKVNG